MENISASYRVSSWKDVEELRNVYRLIFDEKVTIEHKTEAYGILQTWKARRSHDTLNGILCTLSLLDVHLKDVTGKITDPFTLSTLYASTLTKFINFATSFELYKATMYKSAERLGIDSFLVDLRHLCAHGKQLPCLEVFRKSHRYCLNWIKSFFWESEISNITDATITDIRNDGAFAGELQELLLIYDILVEILHMNIVRFEDLPEEDETRLRWPTMDKFMKEKKFRSFRHAFTILSVALGKLIQSKSMSTSPQSFFLNMFEQCEFFMSTTSVLETTAESSEDEDQDEESDGSPAKRSKRESSSVVNLYQNLVWQLARNGYLKLFLDMLYKLSFNEKETPEKRNSARFWITIILGSFRYYQNYCNFSKDNAILQTKITGEVRKIYSYQLDADLRKIVIFVGTQLLPSSLKYSKEFYMQLLNSIDGENEDICVNLLPFVYPPMSTEQLDKFVDLIKIGSSGSSKSTHQQEEKIYTLEDLTSALQKGTNEEASLTWKESLDDIDWSSQPIGADFSFKH